MNTNREDKENAERDDFEDHHYAPETADTKSEESEIRKRGCDRKTIL